MEVTKKEEKGVELKKRNNESPPAAHSCHLVQ